MNWKEVRKIYPNKFVKVQILESHIVDNIRYIDDMAAVQAFDDDKKATRELVRTKDDILVYHTGKEKIEVPIKRIFGYQTSTGDYSWRGWTKRSSNGFWSY